MTKVLYKKLRKAWGYAYIDENKIELYDKMKGKKHLEILIHEKLHIMFPDLEEKAINRHGKDLCNVLWNDGYRKI
jgi:hypothetical protein